MPNLLGVHVSAAGAGAVVTLSAVAEKRYRITGISFSHSATPSAPVLVTIVAKKRDNTDETQSLYLTAAGIAPLPLDYTCPYPNRQCVITVAGDGTSVATLNVYGTTEK